MSGAGFTPGPWLWQDRPGWRSLVTKQDHGAIANLASGRLAGSDEEREANARLIAAAPELYEALEKAVENTDRLIENGHSPVPLLAELLEVAKRALAKARGDQ